MIRSAVEIALVVFAFLWFGVVVAAFGAALGIALVKDWIE